MSTSGKVTFNQYTYAHHSATGHNKCENILREQ